MLEALRNALPFLAGAKPSEGKTSEQQLRDAVVTLLFLLSLSDDDCSDKETYLVRKVLSDRFGLAGEALEQTLDQLRQRAGDSTSSHQDLKIIRESCNPAERGDFLGLCWQMAYADGELSPDEEHLIRRIAQMLHLSHEDYIRAKLKWQASGRSS